LHGRLPHQTRQIRTRKPAHQWEYQGWGRRGGGRGGALSTAAPPLSQGMQVQCLITHVLLYARERVDEREQRNTHVG
jgi:hypothetical protein